MLCQFLQDLLLLHVHVPAHVPPVLVVTLRLFCHSSDGSSNSGGSQSSIDLSQINFALSNAMHPMPTAGRNRARARARGTGH